MTSYFLFVTKKKKKEDEEARRRGGRRLELSQTLWIYLLYSVFALWLDVGGLRGSPSGLFPGSVFFCELLGGSGRRRSLRDGSRLRKPESKCAAKSAPLVLTVVFAASASCCGSACVCMCVYWGGGLWWEKKCVEVDVALVSAQ